MTVTDIPAYLTDLNERQRQAVEAPISQPLRVMAGAGTGKTELIARRFARCVIELTQTQPELDDPTQHILVLTFTDDAAHTMKTRIHNQLLQLGLSGLSPKAWISNFHQFGKRLLSEHAALLGLAPDSTVIADTQAHEIHQTILEAIRQGGYPDCQALLSRYDLSDIPNDCLSPDAFARMGLWQANDLLDELPALVNRIKTAGLSPRQFWETTHQQTQAFTDRLKTLSTADPLSRDPFTNAPDLIRQWHKELLPWADQRWQPLRQADAKADAKAGKAPSDSDYAKQVEVLAKSGWYVSAEGRGAKKVYHPQHHDFADLDRSTAIEHQWIDVITAYYACYQDTLQQQRQFDFDDLINLPIQLLEHFPELRQRYQDYFKAIIVDEFQDSNPSQLQLLTLLVPESEPHITVVGDEKQSIYGFRYAQPENLDLIFAQTITPQTIHLQTNYRSHPDILTLANHVTTSALQLSEHQTLQAPEGKTHASRPTLLSTQWTQYGQPSDDDTPKLSIDALRWQEANDIADRIEEVLREGMLKASDIAILVPKHHKAALIEAMLESRGIASQRQKNRGYFDEPIIKDALALLMLIHNPYESVSWIRLLQKKFSHRQLWLLSQACQPNPLFWGLEQLSINATLAPSLPTDVRQALIELAALMTNAQSQKHSMSVNELFDTLSRRIFDMPQLSRRDRRLLTQWTQWLGQLQRPQRQRYPNPLHRVVSMIRQYSENPALDVPLPYTHDASISDAVTILTIHAAKGLEFPLVFVADTKASERDRPLPRLIVDHQMAGKAGFGLILNLRQCPIKAKLYALIWHKPRYEWEQRRLFYVALTRAKHHLVVSQAVNAADWAQPPVSMDIQYR